MSIITHHSCDEMEALMNDVHSKNGFNPSISRRKFVKGIAAGGVVASIPMSINAKEELPQKVYSSVLSGTVIDLVVANSTSKCNSRLKIRLLSEVRQKPPVAV
ncbi:twin-arginine translocation signal domain-containing protein [Aeromonas hydrophila]